MIFFLNANGVLLKSVPSVVNRGSNNANTICVVAPIVADAVVSIRFQLPNGTYTEQGIMSLKSGIETGLNYEDKPCFVWVYDVPSLITAQSGKVICQIVFSLGSQTIASEGITFDVGDGVPPINIENIEDVSTVDDILSRLSEIQDDVSNATSEVANIDARLDTALGELEGIESVDLPNLDRAISDKLDKAPTNNIPLIGIDGKIDGAYLPEMGGGAVESVNNVLPDENGNIILGPDGVGAVPYEPLPNEPLIKDDKVNDIYLPERITSDKTIEGQLFLKNGGEGDNKFGAISSISIDGLTSYLLRPYVVAGVLHAVIGSNDLIVEIVSKSRPAIRMGDRYEYVALKSEILSLEADIVDINSQLEDIGYRLITAENTIEGMGYSIAGLSSQIMDAQRTADEAKEQVGDINTALEGILGV